MQKVISSLLFCVIFCSAFNNAEVVWNFGQDTPGSYVISRDSGTIQLLEKTKRIPLNIPLCHEVTYVRVTVDNKVSTPSVTYDEQTYTVSVQYSLLQISYSTYRVLVKGRQIPGCSNANNRKPVSCYDQYSRPVACEDKLEFVYPN